MTLKNITPAVMLVTALGAGATAQAEVPGDFTGTVAVTSEYVFRGIDSSTGAAVQGSIDYGHDSGFYASIWGSNTFSDTNEIDFVGGWAGDVGDYFSVDLGALYYLFTEEEERFGSSVDETDYYEVYGGIGVTPFGGVSISGTVYYTTDYFSTSEDGIYYVGSVDVPITDTVTLSGSVGYSDGDGVEDFIGDEYIDYSASLTKSLDWADISFAVTGTNLDENDSGLFADDDAPKFVITLSKGFDF